MSAELRLVATYRLQLTPTFGLDDATALIPYLADLGISHVYTSSYLQAAHGSTHGYDTVDHARVSDELGGEDALVRFHAALRHHGLGNVVDVVPNHMSVADPVQNRQWWNVLRDGPTSPDARFFDIDWSPPESKLAGKVLLGVLGNDYAQELASGAISLVSVGSGPDAEHEIHYGDLRLPVAPGTVGCGIHDVLERQHYRLACWRVARDELNYRRFFDVTTLAGVRVEDPDVFASVHERTLGWVRAGDVQGLRIDHPDGLRDPGGYLDALRTAAPGAWIVVEKILEPGEELRADWPIDGTTGYDVMRRITGVFVDANAAAPMTQTFADFVGAPQTYAEMLIETKRQVLHDLLGAEVSKLAELGARCCETSVVARDFSQREIRAAIVAMLIAMPVYRTYVNGPDSHRADRAIAADLVPAAAAIAPDVSRNLIDFLGSLFTGEASGQPCTEFVARFQQLSGPAMAKGAEDTAFYRYNRLIALNEVGADPAIFGMSVDEFHRESLRTATDHPLTMSSTSTHDTKRSEDVRARIALLSEAPDLWRETVGRWREMNDPKWTAAVPDRATEYLLYQTLVGAHPVSVARTHEFLTKAMREAKQVTSWLQPTDAEATMFAFADALANDAEFQAELDALILRFDEPARLASLAQLALKAMGPGIPDFYQGSELWTTSLVDPDNRVPVDYATRRALLAESAGPAALPLLADDAAGATKLWLTRQLLRIRADEPHAFVGPQATYSPIDLHGDSADAGLASWRGDSVVTVVPIRPLRISANGWGDTSIALPDGLWHDGLDPGSDRTFAGSTNVADIAGTLGLGVLVRVEVGR